MGGKRTLDAPDAWVHGGTMHRLDFALLLLTLALLPLLYVSLWFGIAVAVAAYALVARLAGSDLDRLSRRRKRDAPSRSPTSIEAWSLRSAIGGNGTSVALP